LKSKAVLRAKELRKNLTDAEKRLWYLFRDRRFLGYKFRRQHPVGNYIVDFICIEEFLIIEIDGGQHLEKQNEDAKRTQFLKAQGYRVLRFWNDEVLVRTDSVLEVIAQVLRA